MERPPRHGRYEALRLENAALALVVVPELGGKVVSLVDQRTGVEWLTQGVPPELPERADGADAVFDGGISYGWDECLPSIAPAADPIVEGAVLRDHGDVWGRPARVEVPAEVPAGAADQPAGADSGGRPDASDPDPDPDAGAPRPTLLLASDGLRWPYTFRRRLTLDGATVIATYAVEAHGLPLPFLWSMHPLFDPPPGSRIHLARPDVQVRVGWHAGFELLPAPLRVAWPGPVDPTGSPLRLDVIRGLDARRAMKLVARLAEPGRAAIERQDGSWVGLDWDRRRMPLLGIWLGEGAWPSVDEPVFQIGLEPTNASSDGLPAAIAAGEALTAAPGSPLEWEVRVTLGATTASLEEFLAGG